MKTICKIWIPRVAGSSWWFVASQMLPSAQRRWVKHPSPQEDYTKLKLVTFQHRSLRALLRDGIISRPDFFLCSAVRNPFDRLVSVFHHMKPPGYRGKPKYKELRSIIERGWQYYAEWATSGNTPSLHDSVGDPYCYASPQVDWLTEEDGAPVELDVLGRFDDLRSYSAQTLGLLGRRKPLPSVNRTRHKPFAEYYDDVLRKRAEKFYEADCEQFGYTFGETK